MKHYQQWDTFDANKIQFTLGQEKNGKTSVNMFVGENAAEIAIPTATL